MARKSRLAPVRWIRKQIRTRQRLNQRTTSDKFIQSTLALVGNITIQWASVELYLNHLIAWHFAATNKSVEPELPLMLKNRLAYLKKMEKSGQFTDEQCARFRRYRLEIDRLSELRHNIIHGVLHQRNRWSTVWHTHSVKFGKQSFKIIEATYTHAEILQHLKEVGTLGHDMSPYIAAIVGIPHPANSA